MSRLLTAVFFSVMMLFALPGCSGPLAAAGARCGGAVACALSACARIGGDDVGAEIDACVLDVIAAEVPECAADAIEALREHDRSP